MAYYIIYDSEGGGKKNNRQESIQIEATSMSKYINSVITRQIDAISNCNSYTSEWGKKRH